MDRIDIYLIDSNIIIFQQRGGNMPPRRVATDDRDVRMRQPRGTRPSSLRQQPGRSKAELHYKPGPGPQGHL